MSAPDDARFMAAALSLARRGLGRTAPNPAVGAILVSPGGDVISRGWTRPGGRPHAERIALDAAGDRAAGATLYVTLEPCSHFGLTPPCVEAVVTAGVARVVAAIGDPDPRVSGRGFDRLREAGITVTLGVGAEEAARLTAGHVSRISRGRPLVGLKMAVSRDGKVALPGRRTAFITGEASRSRVHMMRAEADAIMVGVGTVLGDDPQLTCRLPGMDDRSPIRVILDAGLRTPESATLVATARETPTWLIAAKDSPDERERRLQEEGAEVLRVEREPGGRLDLDAVLNLLGVRGVTRLMVEGGPMVAGALLKRDLVDEAAISTGPCTLGPAAIDAFEGLPLAAIAASPDFRPVDAFRVGDDDWATYERVKTL